MIIAIRLFGDVSFFLLARYIELLTTELFRFKMAELVIFFQCTSKRRRRRRQRRWRSPSGRRREQGRGRLARSLQTHQNDLDYFLQTIQY